MRTVAVVTVVLSLTLLPAVSRADDTEARARERFNQGAQAYREARYKDAIDLFLQANRLDPHAELVFNVGQAYEKLGDVPNALRSYRDYLRKAPGASDRGTVEASIRNLETRLREKGVQQVSVFSTPAGATVLLDQKEVGRTPWTGEIAPGRHIVVLKASGFPDTAKEFLLAADRAVDLDLSLSRTGTGATTVPPETDATSSPAPAQEARAKPHVKPWTFATLGVGVVGLGAALGLELARKGAEDAARADATQTGYADKYATMTSRQTAARVLVGVGAAVTAVGGVLLVIDLRGSAQTPPRQASVGCFGAGCGVFAGGSF